MLGQVELDQVFHHYIGAFERAGLGPEIEKLLAEVPDTILDQIAAHPGFVSWMGAVQRDGEVHEFAETLLDNEIERYKLRWELFSGEELSVFASEFVNELTDENWGLSAIGNEINQQVIQNYTISDPGELLDGLLNENGFKEKRSDDVSAAHQLREAMKYLAGGKDRQVMYVTAGAHGDLLDGFYAYFLEKGDSGEGLKGKAVFLPEINEAEKQELMRKLGVVEASNGVEYWQFQGDKGDIDGKRLVNLVSEVTNGRVDAELRLRFPLEYFENGEREVVDANREVVGLDLEVGDWSGLIGDPLLIAWLMVDNAWQEQSESWDSTDQVGVLDGSETVASSQYGEDVVSMSVAGDGGVNGNRSGRKISSSDGGRDGEGSDGDDYAGAGPLQTEIVQERFSEPSGEVYLRKPGQVIVFERSYSMPPDLEEFGGITQADVPKQVAAEEVVIFENNELQVSRHSGEPSSIRNLDPRVPLGIRERQRLQSQTPDQTVVRKKVFTPMPEEVAEFGRVGREILLVDQPELKKAPGVIVVSREVERAVAREVIDRPPASVIQEALRAGRTWVVPILRSRTDDSRRVESIGKIVWEKLLVNDYLNEIEIKTEESEINDGWGIDLATNLVVPSAWLKVKEANRVTDWLMAFVSSVRTKNKKTKIKMHHGLVWLVALNLLVEHISQTINMINKHRFDMLKPAIKEEITVIRKPVQNQLKVDRWEEFVKEVKTGNSGEINYGRWGRLSLGPKVMHADKINRNRIDIGKIEMVAKIEMEFWSPRRLFLHV